MSGREVGSPVAQDLVGRGVRAERPAHRDDRMLRCSHPMRAADSDWLKFKSEGRDVENVTHCYPCMDSRLMANYRPHEFTDVE